MRHVEEVKREKHPEDPRKHSYTDDMKKDKQREESRHERPINTPQHERPQSEKPADNKPIFERWEEGGSKTHPKTSSRASDLIIYFRRGVLDGSILYPTRYPSPRPARPPLQIKRPSVDPKKDRSGLVRTPELKSMIASKVPADTAWHKRRSLALTFVPTVL